jgi:hypothetical protein
MLHIPTPIRRNKIETAVNPTVLNVATIESALGLEVLLELLVNVVHACFPTILTVNGVSES